MAPQQNSTLIDSNLEVMPSLLNMPEEIERYSPILPFHNQLPHCKNNNNNNNNNNSKENKKNNANNNHNHKNKNNIPFNSNEDICNSKNDRKTCNRMRKLHDGLCRRNHSLLLYNKNSITSNNRHIEGHKEIPIWLDNEPRYVSGVTYKTTCNDIIKALIDDEIRNGNFAYCKCTPDGAVWRDYRDYVITERCRGIERNYEGNMAILPVWKAWNRVHNELRLSLKYQGKMDNPLPLVQPKRGFAALKKYFTKFLRFTKKAKTKEKTETRNQNQCLAHGSKEIPDEFLFVFIPNDIPPPKSVNAKGRDENKNFAPTAEEAAKQAEAKLVKENLHRFTNEADAFARKRRPSSRRTYTDRKASERRRRTFDSNFSCIKRRKDMPHRNSLRNQLAKKTGEIDQLFNREYALSKHLRSACKLYKLQNDLYLEPEKQLELSVGQIQRNIERYAKEIVRTENELLEVKNEIQQDMSIINNLKRLTLESSNQACDGFSLPAKGPAKEPTTTANTFSKENNQMQFVDNIYEFCDNNASMLV